MTKSKLYTYIKTLSVIGILLAVYLLWQKYFDPVYKPCNISDTINCDAIINGPVSKFLGIPTPLVGLVGYLVIFFSADQKKDKLMLGMALFGLVFCLRIFIIELFQLKVTCPVCIACQIDMFLCALLAFIAVRKKEAPVQLSN